VNKTRWNYAALALVCIVGTAVTTVSAYEYLHRNDTMQFVVVGHWQYTPRVHEKGVSMYAKVGDLSAKPGAQFAPIILEEIKFVQNGSDANVHTPSTSGLRFRDKEGTWYWLDPTISDLKKIDGPKRPQLASTDDKSDDDVDNDEAEKQK
jgi:hypothetical protein